MGAVSLHFTLLGFSEPAVQAVSIDAALEAVRWAC